MAPFFEHETTGKGVYAALRFILHLCYLAKALEAVATAPRLQTFFILIFAATNAVLVIRPTRRSFRTRRLRTACSLLSWTGHSLETVYWLPIIIRHTHVALWVVLLCCGLAYVLDLSRYDLLLTFIRSTTWTSVLLFANGTTQCIGYTLVLWAIACWVGFTKSIFCISAIFLLGIAPAALDRPLCAFQDRLSDWRVRRARGPNGNAWNPAACLPAEVQLEIFHLLRTRGRFGSREHLARDTEFRSDVRLIPFSGARDLASVSRVCSAWRAAATEALYRDAILLTAWRTCAFSRSLAARPALAQLVRRIVLPEWETYSPTGTEKIFRATWGEFSAAIEHVVSQCAHATEIRLFRDQTPMLDHIPGLRAATQHVSHLAIQSGVPNRYNFPRVVHEPEELDLALLLGWLPSLSALTLTGQRVALDVAALRAAQRRALRGIHALSLGACSLNTDQLVLLIRLLPRLRIADLRDLDFSDSHGVVSISDLFATQRGTLVELRLLVDRNTPVAKRRIAFSTFGAFVALRTLAVNSYMLPGIVTFPPNLEELVVSLAPYSSDGHLSFREQWRKHLFAAVDDVSVLVPTAPMLRYVQLWDDVYLTQLGHWSVAAFMLREILAGSNIALDVNLFIEMFNNFKVKHDLSKRKRMRRFFWQGVL